MSTVYEDLPRTVDAYQRRTLDETARINPERPISDATVRAFLEVPRHAFVRRYRDPQTAAWRHVDPAALDPHLGALYGNHPLVIHANNDDEFCTMSQAGFVLRMLDLLDLRPGYSVFCLGAGAGWDAALMGHLVGPSGHVHGFEIVPELAQMARDTLAAQRIDNVRIMTGDGAAGYAPGAPYDRAIAWASLADLPREYYTLIKDGGLLLTTIRNGAGGGHLCLLRKTGDRFTSIESRGLSFEQISGKYRNDALELTTLDRLWPDAARHEVSRTRFWWGGAGRHDFSSRTFTFRCWLGITEPCACAFKTRQSEREPWVPGFGVWIDAERSLVSASDEWLVAYGNEIAKHRLLQRLRDWVDVGMPAPASYELEIAPCDLAPRPAARQWICTRTDSAFIWRLRD